MFQIASQNVFLYPDIKCVYSIFAGVYIKKLFRKLSFMGEFVWDLFCPSSLSETRDFY